MKTWRVGRDEMRRDETRLDSDGRVKSIGKVRYGSCAALRNNSKYYLKHV